MSSISPSPFGLHHAHEEFHVSAKGVRFDFTSDAIAFPGIANIFTGPIYLFLYIKDTIQASHFNDSAGICEGLGRIASTTLSFLGSIVTLTSFIYEYLGKDFKSLLSNFAAQFLGIVICSIEFLYEAGRFIQQLYFHFKLIDPKGAEKLSELQTLTREGFNEYKKQAEKLIKKLDHVGFADHKDFLMKKLNSLTFENASQIRDKLTDKIQKSYCLYNIQVLRQYYLPESLKNNIEENRQGLNPDEKRAATSLSRRLQPWLVNEFLQNQETFFTRLSDSIFDRNNEALLDKSIQDIANESKELSESINKQSKKALIINTVALIALGITIALIALPTFGLPILAPIAATLIATTVSTITALLKYAVLPSKGYECNLRYLLPTCLRPNRS